jgi:hypothetical protein
MAQEGDHQKLEHRVLCSLSKTLGKLMENS